MHFILLTSKFLLHVFENYLKFAKLAVILILQTALQSSFQKIALQISLWHQISEKPMPFLTQLLAKMTTISVYMCGTFLSKFDFRGTCVNNCNFYLFFFLSQLQTKSNLTVSLSSMSHWWQKQNGTINYLLHMTWDSLLVYSLSESSHLHWIWGLSVHLQLLY